MEVLLEGGRPVEAPGPWWALQVSVSQDEAPAPSSSFPAGRGLEAPSKRRLSPLRRPTSKTFPGPSQQQPP